MKVKEGSEFAGGWGSCSTPPRPGLHPTQGLAQGQVSGDLFCYQNKCHHNSKKKFFLKESEKAGLKLNNQKRKIMASSPIMSWQIEGETMETVTDFIFLGSKITADGNCSHEMKRHLLLGREAVLNLDSILKTKDTTLLTKVHIVKAMVFPAVMHGCESWTIKEVEN